MAVIILEMFSGFVWRIEDHELHGSNPLYMGVDKTGYRTSQVGKLLEYDFIYLFFLFFKESKWHSPNNTMKMFQGK